MEAGPFPSRGSTPGDSGELVLLVDDDPLILRLLTEGLATLGYRTLTAGNGRAGLDLFNSNRDEVAVVLTDIVMPEMDGFECARHIREQSSTVGVILMTGFSMKEGAEVPDDIDGLLRKPFAIHELSLVLERVLARRRS